MPKVMLVDDDQMVLRTTASILRGHGYEVREFSSPEVALDAALESALDPTKASVPEVLVTDVQMPRMGGRELADQMRAIFPGLKVIFISGFVDDEELTERVKEGRELLLMKPGALSALPETISTVMHC